MATGLDTMGRSASGAPAAPGARDAGGALRRHLPNAITVLRLVLAAGFFVTLAMWEATEQFMVQGGRGRGGIEPVLLFAAILFVAAALTDMLDGYLARRWGVVSVFGRIMDPFADKVLVVGAFIFLAGPAFHIQAPSGKMIQLTGVQPWMAVLILARELLVTSIRGVAESCGIDFGAVAFGKAKMVLQSVTVPVVLLTLAIWPGPWSVREGIFINLLIWATIAVTIASGVPYVLRGARAFRGGRTGS